MQKEKLDERFSAISQRVESFSSVHKDFCGKHVRFDSSSSGDEGSGDSTYEKKKVDTDSSNDLKLSLQINKSADRPSSCPYPSATEEMMRLGLKGEVSGHATPIGSQKHCIGSGTLKRKRRSRSRGHTTSGTSTSSKKFKEDCSLPVKDDFGNSEEGSGFEAEYEITNNSLRMFVTMWKDGCRDMTVAEVCYFFYFYFSHTLTYI